MKLCCVMLRDFRKTDRFSGKHAKDARHDVEKQSSENATPSAVKIDHCGEPSPPGGVVICAAGAVVGAVVGLSE